MSTQCAKIAKVDVRLLGPFSIRQDGSAIEDRLTGPARALCIYLMVNAGQDFSREHLICAIWPEDKPPTRSAFNTTLWRLKKFLCDIPGLDPVCLGETLKLDVSTPATIDVDRLIEAGGRAEDPDMPDAMLWSAIDSWRGVFAEGISTNWALVLRERLHAAYIRALLALMRRAGRARRFDEALGLGQRILEEDPFREGVHCEVMWLYVLTGQRARAITSHICFCRMLHKELGIGPVAETTALFKYIRDGLEDSAGTTGASGASPLTARRYEGFLEVVEQSRASVYAALQTMHTGT